MTNNLTFENTKGLEWGHVGFDIAFASNGFVFREYHINSDAFLVAIFQSPDELEKHIRRWFEDKVSGIQKWGPERAKAWLKTP